MNNKEVVCYKQVVTSDGDVVRLSEDGEYVDVYSISSSTDEPVIALPLSVFKEIPVLSEVPSE